jgi:hypothetical protein
MKSTLIVATLLLWLIAFTPAASAQTSCSCKAPDGKCETAVTCPHGCTALCGSKDACYTACGSVEADQSYARITLKVENKSSEEIASLLSRHSGRKIEFKPLRKNIRYSFELKNDPVWNALKFLNRRGSVLVDETPFDKLEELRRRVLKGEKVSVNFNDISARNALAKLSFMSGLPFRVESGDAEKLLSLSLQNVTLEEIVASISKQASITIVKRELRRTSRASPVKS